jgi:hypothetical protein
MLCERSYDPLSRMLLKGNAVAERSFVLPPVIYGLRSATVASDQEMESYARECVRLAQLTDDPNIREQLRQMAREWMATAMHEEELPDPTASIRL